MLSDERFDAIMGGHFATVDHYEGSMGEALGRALPGLSEQMRDKLLEWVIACLLSEGTGDLEMRWMLAFIEGIEIGKLVAGEV